MKRILKSVFIIAIVAVAMIGVEKIKWNHHEYTISKLMEKEDKTKEDFKDNL